MISQFKPIIILFHPIMEKRDKNKIFRKPDFGKKKTDKKICEIKNIFLATMFPDDINQS